MAFLADVTTVDTQSVDGNCTYPPLAIGGGGLPTTVVVKGNPLRIIAGDPTKYTCVPVPGQKINPLSPIPCQPGVRFIEPRVNTTVRINGMLPAVTGDEAQLTLGGAPRPLTGPFQHPTIVIGSNVIN